MSNFRLALLRLAGVRAAAAATARIVKEVGTRPQAVVAAFLSVVTLSACFAAFPDDGTTPPDVESSPTPLISTVPPVDSPTLEPTAYTGAIDPPVINCFELLTTAWILNGAANGAVQPETFQEIDGLLQGSEVLKIVIDIHGASFAEGSEQDESAIIIDQPDGQWTVASLATHGLDNGVEGPQEVYIDLNDFTGPNGVLDLNQPYGPLHPRFWNETGFTVEISSIMACNYQRV